MFSDIFQYGQTIKLFVTRKHIETYRIAFNLLEKIFALWEANFVYAAMLSVLGKRENIHTKHVSEAVLPILPKA